MHETEALELISSRIRGIRGERVMLDADLAPLYGVTTKQSNQQVQRNLDRFPVDFAFRLTRDEWSAMYPQVAGTTQARRRLDSLPMAFTEHGCLMLSNVLRSPKAVEVSVLIVRAFVRLRGVLAANRELAARVDELSAEIGAHGRKLATHEKAIMKLLAEIRQLTEFPERPSRPIGFTAGISGGPNK